MKMKSLKSFLLASIFLLILSTYNTYHVYASGSSITYSQKTVSVGSNSIKLNILVISDSDNYSFKVVHNNPVGSVNDLKNLVAKVDGTAGVNGTFFDAYNSDSTKRYPYGILIDNKNIIRGGTNVSFLSDGTLRFGKLNVVITGSINGSYKWPNNWYAWNINNVYKNNRQSVIFTSAFGKTPDDDSTNVIVSKGEVVEIVNEPVTPLRDGYVIHIGTGEKIKERFKIGDKVEYKVDFEMDGQPFSSDIVFAVGAGPKLLSNGNIDIDFERDGFSETKITSMRTARSFIGINKDGSIIMGTTPKASIKELASALSQLGVTDAINLDGGASSGLYFQGKYITQPGRQISNALVVVEKTFIEASIVIEGNLLSQNGLIKEGTTYVPLRGVLENLGIEITWNNLNKSVTCKKGEQEFILSINSTKNSDGFMYESKSYVPLRLISEKFGYKVSWNSQTKQVEISK